MQMAPPSFDQNKATISAIHPDIIETHILTRLDGPTLASFSSVSSQLHSLITSNESLWTNICHSTWPSTNTPRLRHVISSFSHGPRSFFSESFTYPDSTPASTSSSSSTNLNRSSELISAVDIYYKSKLIFSKVVETETGSRWFSCFPFRVDLLDPKDNVPTRIPHPEKEDACRELAEDLTLSWILIDPISQRAMNLTSYKQVTVQRHWLSGEAHLRFATVLPGGDKGSPSEFVLCEIMVTCGGSQDGEMHVREVGLQAEDMDGTILNGKDSLEILQKGLQGERANVKKREEEGKRKYEGFMEKKRERKETKLRAEGRLDMLCVAFGVFSFFSCGLFFLWR